MENVRFDTNLKPSVVVSWSAPSVRRSHDGVKNYTIIVTNKDDVIVDNATVMRDKTEYTFNGEYYTSYNFEVSLGDLSAKKQCPVYRGVSPDHSCSVVPCDWSTP